jgi:hypothetical protein
VGELPNSHGRTLPDKSYVLHGIPYLSTPFITSRDHLINDGLDRLGFIVAFFLSFLP